MFRQGLFLGALFVLNACTTGTAAISESLRLLTPGNDQADQTPLQSGMRYLRSESAGHVALLVLGYTEPHAHGKIEIWYSGKGEVLKLQQGRVVGTVGLKTDWRAVRLPALPHWNEVRQQPVRYVRERDEMPGYRLNIRETVLLQAISPPTRSSLRQMNAEQLRWYEERTEPPIENLPAARFAVDWHDGVEVVVYSEQCLAPDICFTLQRWPVAIGGRR